MKANNDSTTGVRSLLKKFRPDEATVLLVLSMLSLGIVLFYISDSLAEDEFLIRVTSADKEHLENQWMQQFGVSPNEVELNNLIAEWTIEEAMVREALRLGLDQNDTIIRRRLRQKLEYLLGDQDFAIEVSEDRLRSFFDSRRELYAIPEKVDFIHVFFTGENRSNPRQDAATARVSINERNWQSIGDPFPLSRSFTEVSFEEVRRDFGYRFETSLLNANLGEWTGPVTSWYGIHLIRVAKRKPSEPVMFEQARADVLRDFEMESNENAKQSYVEEIASKYRVEIEL